MTHDIITTMLPESPFIDISGKINVKSFAKALNINQAVVVSATHQSRQLISQHFKSKSKYINIKNKEIRKFWIDLSKIYILLKGILGRKDSDKVIPRWLITRNVSLDMERPIDIIMNGQSQTIIRKLIDIVEASQGG